MPTLNWIGKEKVVSHHHDVPFRVLEHKYRFDGKSETLEKEKKESKSKKGLSAKESKSNTKSQKVPSPVERAEGEVGANKIIHGDNLEALKSLLPEYEGKIKCIYIDPPYNTGNENWVYNDNVNHPKIKKWLSQVVGKDGEDLTRHDKWLCMMYPRLKLLHKLLANDGAIFISIDDNELSNLKFICDEIFGYKNLISTLIWDLGTGTQAGHFVRSHEYILAYFKNKELVPNFKGGDGVIEHSALKKISIKNPSSEFTFPAGTRFDAADGFELKDVWGGSEKTTLLKGRMIAQGGKLSEEVTLSAGWAQKNQMITFFKGERTIDSKGQLVKSFYFNRNGILRYEKERSVVNPPTVLRDVASTKNGSSVMAEIFSDHMFDFPKPVEIIKFFVELSTDKSSIILDSFAGSGTTAHAVLNLNKQDGGNRKFILIEMEEYAETITAERVKRVINGYGDVEGTGGSFDYLELGKPLFTGDNNEYLNEEVSTEKIREYVWYSETRTAYEFADSKNDTPYFLGKLDGTAYYFIYEKNELTTLDYDSLATIKNKSDQYIIYADNCLLPKEFMMKHNIVFKKIPRDISRF